MMIGLKKGFGVLSIYQMEGMMFDFNVRFSNDILLLEFSQWLMEYQARIGYRVSSRGWCYLLESERMINKDQFNKAENVINRCRKKGFIPIDFVAEEPSRDFEFVTMPTEDTPLQWLKSYLEAPLHCEDWYEPDWHDGEEYYIQCVVEKIDLKTLFGPVCEKYHIPIANSKGWSSMLQRANYSRRFSIAESRGMKCVLLYCGDHDPDGVRISDFIRKNLSELKDVSWSDGLSGFDPKDLEINRFGLNYKFIENMNLTWIDNLITGSGKNLASPTHKNFRLPYVQEYLKTIGNRKCEANAIMPYPVEARKLIENTILSYTGAGVLDRFDDRHQLIKDQINDFREESGVDGAIYGAIKLME